MVDVRDGLALEDAVSEGVGKLGRLDIVSANAGLGSFGRANELTAEEWATAIGVNLTGVWHTYKAAIAHIRAGGRGGSITFTSSGAGAKGVENMAHYVASKTGVLGLMKALALEHAQEMIRVNTILPTTVKTDLIMNEPTAVLSGPREPAARRHYSGIHVTQCDADPVGRIGRHLERPVVPCVRRSPVHRRCGPSCRRRIPAQVTPSAASTTAIGAPRLHPIGDPKTVSLTQTVRRPAAPAGISEEGRPFLLISGAHPVPELPDIPHDDHAAWIEFLTEQEAPVRVIFDTAALDYCLALDRRAIETRRTRPASRVLVHGSWVGATSQWR